MNPRALPHLNLWRGIGRVLIAIMLVVALLPMPRGIGAVPFGDKIGHFLAFGGLVIWYAQIYSLLPDRCRCMLGAVALGALIELLQMGVPYRSAEAMDLLADALGAGLGLVLASTPLGSVLSRLDVRRV